MAHIGPVLPPGWKPTKGDDDSEHSDDNRTASPVSPANKSEEQGPSASEDCYGPALPPDLLGPALPPDMIAGGHDNDQESDDDLPVGPVPESESADAYDYRLLKLRREKEEEEESRKRKGRREEWMTELPSKLSKSYGLTARTFKKHDSSGGGDASAWTDTPEERQRNQGSKGDKSNDEKTILHKAAAERDRKYDAEVERLNEKRSKESLVDLHTKKAKKEKEEAEKSGKQDRRPFDREKDLKIVNLKSSSERNTTLEKMRELGTRFGHGGDQKYL